MKTKVNLYTAELQPKLRLITLGFTLLSWLVLLVILGAYWVFTLNQQDTLRVQLDKINQQRDQQADLATSLQGGLANRQADPQLMQQVNQKVSELAAKNQVLQELLGQEVLKTNSFATLMQELARHHQAGLWLTHITLDGKQVKLAGAALEWSVVPVWIKSLGETAYFTGQEFAETRLFRDAEQQLNFVISSSPIDTAFVTGEANKDE